MDTKQWMCIELNSGEEVSRSLEYEYTRQGSQEGEKCKRLKM